MTPRDGGPAFPAFFQFAPAPESPDQPHIVQEGMSIRDYAAISVMTTMGHAIGGGINQRTGKPYTHEEIVARAYRIADQVLRERERKDHRICQNCKGALEKGNGIISGEYAYCWPCHDAGAAYHEKLPTIYDDYGAELPTVSRMALEAHEVFIDPALMGVAWVSKKIGDRTYQATVESDLIGLRDGTRYLTCSPMHVYLNDDEVRTIRLNQSTTWDVPESEFKKLKWAW